MLGDRKEETREKERRKKEHEGEEGEKRKKEKKERNETEALTMPPLLHYNPRVRSIVLQRHSAQTRIIVPYPFQQLLRPPQRRRAVVEHSLSGIFIKRSVALEGGHFCFAALERAGEREREGDERKGRKKDW